MQSTTESRSKKRRGAIVCAALLFLLLIGYLGMILFLMVSEPLGDLLAWIFLLLYLVIIAAVVLGIFFALRQRLSEIDTGEEEEAKKY